MVALPREKRAMMVQLPITLISFGYLQKGIIEHIAADVRSEFKVPVTVRDGHLDLSLFYDPARRQYNGDHLLPYVDREFGNDGCKTMGLFSVDLFIPILTYIFGQAFLNGGTGIASLYRLGDEKYGMAPDEGRMSERFSKEVIHELGHTFGLVHCHNPVCVMRSGTYVEEIDQKEGHLCSRCREHSGFH